MATDRAAAQGAGDGPPAISATILVVDDDRELLRVLERTLKGAGYTVVARPDAESGLAHVKESTPDLVITDLMLPGRNGLEFLADIKAVAPQVGVLLITAHASLERAVEAMRNGAHDFLEKPFERGRLLLTVQRALEKQALTAENRRLKERLKDHEALDRMVGASRVMTELRRLVAQIASSDVPVLITGESGTGKEVVADLLHGMSGRRAGPLIKISCAAIPENLLESELFGYERGAFSGANQTKRGRFELADGGTLFLDEIGEMSPAMQAKLLRVLQDQKVQRLGGTKDVPVDVRLVTATNIDLARAMERERFRADLYHRINVIELNVPPLRERIEDLPLLVAHFLRLHRDLGAVPVTGLSPGAFEALSGHGWFGNVRELENVVQRALVTATGPVIEAADLHFPQHAPAGAGRSENAPGIVIAPGTRLDEVEELLIADTLRRVHGDKERAARMLGISVRTLYRRATNPSVASSLDPLGDAGEKPA